MILLIDNYDSFTYNLVQYLHELGAETQVHYNNKITLRDVARLKPEKIIISPGPGTPDDAGISLDLIKKFSDKIPILGVCLGHQAIAQVFGGSIVTAKFPVHGKTSLIYHTQQDVFKNIKTPFIATRYHSLIVAKKNLPDCFMLTAWTQNEKGNFAEIMGIKHRHLKLSGVQFHPESIATESGYHILKNFLQQN